MSTLNHQLVTIIPFMWGTEVSYGKDSGFCCKASFTSDCTVQGKKKRFAAQSEVHCILGFSYSWSLTLPFSTRMIMLKHVRACTCVHTRYTDLQCLWLKRLPCVFTDLQRLAQILICGIRLVQIGIILLWIYGGKMVIIFNCIDNYL